MDTIFTWGRIADCSALPSGVADCSTLLPPGAGSAVSELLRAVEGKNRRSEAAGCTAPLRLLAGSTPSELLREATEGRSMCASGLLLSAEA